MHICDLAVSEAIQVPQCELGRSVMVENYIGDSRELSVAGNRDGRCREEPLELSVDREDAVYAAGLQETGVLCNQVFPVAVVSCEEEVAFLHQDIGSSAEYLRVVALAEFWKQDADGLRSESLQ